MTSVEGAAGRQCVPTDGVCGGGGDSCEGDAYDPDDDTPEGAEDVAIASNYSDDLVICPDNQDWFALTVSQSTILTIAVDGDSPPDIDLQLLRADLTAIDSSTLGGSNEEVESPCLEPGTYYAMVEIYQGGAVAGNYSIDVQFDTQTCAGAACCEASATPGCPGDSLTEECVCALDSFCCATAWDVTCVGVATEDCLLECS